MTSKLITLEKAPFLPIALFSYSLAIKYFEDLRRLSLKSEEFDHVFTFFVLFIVIGTLSATCYVVLLFVERNVSKNLEKNRDPIKDKNKQYIILDIEEVTKNPQKLEKLINTIFTEKRKADTANNNDL